jgi:hypothetical protein
VKLYSDGRITLSIEFDPSVPGALRAPWEARLRESLAPTAVVVLPAPARNAAPVSVMVAVMADTGDTAQGPEFHAARARAVVRLHRAVVVVEGRPGASREQAEAIRKTLADLVDRVALVLTW